MSVDVAVIGAGVSGLTAAHELLRRGHRVVVLERQVRAGGNAVSERVGGFLMEHGPSSVNAASCAAAEFSTSLGLDPLVCGLGSEVRYRYLTGRDGLHRVSTHPLGFLLSNYLSPGARLRVLAEPAIPRGNASIEESVAGFWSRRFGPEFAERVIDPLTGGLVRRLRPRALDAGGVSALGGDGAALRLDHPWDTEKPARRRQDARA